MKTIKSFVLIPLIGAFLCACGAAGGGGTNVSVNDIGNVEGTVTDASSNAALAGVTVQIGDKTATTADNGIYSITDLAVGSRTITATKTGYQNYNGTATVTKGTTVTQNIQMTLTGAGDTTPPTVSSADPANNATGVALNQAITVTFSEAMDCSTITTSIVTLKDNLDTAVAGTISTCNNTTAVFTPSSNLSYSTLYTATITTGVKDAAGNAMAANYTWNFTTEPLPIPSAPSGVSATAGDGQITISWNSVSGATSYNIYLSTSTGVTKTNGTKLTGVTSPYTHTGRTNGATYYYVVTAVNSSGESSESSQLSAIPQATPVAAGQWDAMVWDTGVWGN